MLEALIAQQCFWSTASSGFALTGKVFRATLSERAPLHVWLNQQIIQLYDPKQTAQKQTQVHTLLTLIPLTMNDIICRFSSLECVYYLND